MNHKSQRHEALFAMVRRTGRTTIAPVREPSVHELYGHQTSRTRRLSFVPRDLE